MSRYFRIRCFSITVVLAFGVGAAFAAEAERLRSYGADLSQTSVSGLSSGAAMAVQFQVAYSASVKGAGVIAGAPYGCAQRSLLGALWNCMQPSAMFPLPKTDQLQQNTDALSRAGAIDDVANLRHTRVWLFSGTADDVVRPAAMSALRDYYLRYMPADHIVFRDDVGAAHAMVTDDNNIGCAVKDKPYIVDCDLDAAGALLKQIYDEDLAPRNTQPAGDLLPFDQREFFPDQSAYNHSLDDVGFVYVPKECATRTCRVHVALHGCAQQAAEVGDRFYTGAGYNRWADTNRIIVLYPQTISRFGWGWPFYTLNVVFNPNACWDWWGYDGADYNTKKGAQLAAIRAMVERLAGAR